MENSMAYVQFVDDLLDTCKDIGRELVGHNEKVHQMAIWYGLCDKGYNVDYEATMTVIYKGRCVGSVKPDLVVRGIIANSDLSDVVVEVKRVNKLTENMIIDQKRYGKNVIIVNFGKGGDVDIVHVDDEDEDEDESRYYDNTDSHQESECKCSCGCDGNCKFVEFLSEHNI